MKTLFEDDKQNLSATLMNKVFDVKFITIGNKLSIYYSGIFV